MIPKPLLPKRSLGSPPASSAAIGFSFGSKDNIIKGHSKQSSQTMNRTSGFPSRCESMQKFPSQVQEEKITTLMKDIQDARETLKENKKVILNELPAFRDSLKQEMQTLMLYFVDNLKNSRENHARELQIYMDTLQSQAAEKDVVNQNLMETNKVLAQKNEALSTMLVSTTSQLSIANAKEVSPERPIEPMKYARIYSKKLMYESKTISNHIGKQQTLNPYNSARIKAQVGQLREYAVRSYRDPREKPNLLDKQEEKPAESSALSKLLTVGSTKMMELPQSPLKEMIDHEDGDEQGDVMWSAIQSLVEELEGYRRVAVEENNRYIEAMRGLEETIKEKNGLLEIVKKYDVLVSENEDVIRNSRKMVKELSAMAQGGGAHNEELERVVEEFQQAKEMWEKKEQLLGQENEQITKQLENVKGELALVMQDFKRLAKKKSGSKSRKQSTETLKRVDSMPVKESKQKQEDDVEKEVLRKELEMVRHELEIEKTKHSEKLKIHDENYSSHLRMITELHIKIEELTGECEQLRKTHYEKEGEGGWKAMMKEKCRVESPEELVTRYEDLENKLKKCVEEKEEAMKENEMLKFSLEELRVRMDLEKEIKQGDDEVNKEDSERIKELENKLTISGKTMSELEQKIMLLDKEKVELSAKCKSYQDKIEQQSKQQDGLIAQYEVKLKELKDQLSESVGIIEQIKQQIMLLEKEKSELTAQVKENKGHSSKPGDQNRMYESARSSLNEVKIKELERKLEDSLESISQLKKQIAGLEKEKDDEKVLHEVEINESKLKIKRLEGELTESLELGNQLEKQIEVYEKEKSGMESNIGKYKDIIKQLEEEMDIIKNDSKDRSEEKFKELKRKLAQLEKEKQDLGEEIKTCKTKMSYMEVKVLEMDAAQSNWNDDKKLLEENMAIINKEKQDLFKKNKEYQDIVENLKMQLGEVNVQRAGSRRQSTAQRRPTLDNKDEIELLKQKLKDAEEDYEELCSEKEILEKLAKMEREKAEDLEKKIMNQKQEYEDRIQEYKDLLMEFQDDTENQKGQEEDLMQKYMQLQKTCDDFEFKCEILTREKEEFERDLVVCQEEKEEIIKELESYLGHPYKKESFDMDGEDNYDGEDQS